MKAMPWVPAALVVLCLQSGAWVPANAQAPSPPATPASAPAASASAALNVDALWNFNDPAASEQRFLAASAQAGADDRLILQTQIARTHGLRGDFTRAREVLSAVEPRLGTARPEVRVRYHLELGRTWASGRHGPQTRTPEALAAARQNFLRADELAVAAGLDHLAIDALHMMVFVDIEPDQQLGWNERALARLAQSTQPAALRWEGSLRNNVGYALHQKGDFDGALREFRLSRAAYQRDGRTRNVRIADWMTAWTLRSLTQIDAALAIQLRLEQEWAAAGEPDPYVFEELAHLYRAQGDTARAAAYDAKLEATKAPKKP